MLGLPPPSPLLRSTPPHSPEAERAVLGALLIDPNALDEVRPVVTQESFYSAAHGHVYAAILELHATRQPFDVVTLHGLLEGKGTLEQVGGTLALAELSEAVPTSANAKYYAEKVRGTALKRAVISACASAQAMAFESLSLSGEEVAREAEAMVLKATQRANEGEKAHHIADVANDLCALMMQGGKVAIETGIGGLDGIGGGMFPGQLVLIGARTSHGKTSMLLSILRHVARTAGPVAIFSLEESRQQIAQRCAVADAGVRNTDVRGRSLAPLDLTRYMHAVDQLAEGHVPILIDDQTETVEAICSRARYLVAREGVIAIGVDYAQLMRSEKEFRSDVERIGYVSKCLKRLARRANVPVLACAQINRGVEGRKDRKMSASDLKGSGSLEEDSDQVWIIMRPHKFDSALDPRAAKGSIDKHRGGPTGEFKMTFRPEQEEFVSWEGNRPWAN